MVDPVTIQTAAAVVSALAASGILAVAVKLYQLVKEHDRVLHGEPSVDGWNGLVPMVRKNRQRSKRNAEQVERLKRACETDD